MTNLISFEEKILEKLLAGDHPLLNQLRLQVGNCRVSRREFTGVGFYTYFVIEPIPDCSIRTSLKFGDVIAEIDGLQHGAGFLLYVKDGMITMLEGYSYDESWPEKIVNFDLSYVGGKRDWAKLKGILGENP